MYDTILAAIDLEDFTGRDRIAAVAMRIAQDQGAKLHLVNVVPDFGMSIVGSFFSADQAKRIVDDEAAKFKAWAADTVPAEMNAAVSVVKGNIYSSVLEAAEEAGADLIVIGAHRPEIEDYLLGPNSARIARHSKASVFVVRS